ncbi:MAG: ATP-binding cassette domain-containing protein [Actinomycetota bacterium]
MTVRFGAFTAVDDVSLRLDSGRIHVVVGQNGAGKTTLARALAGLQTPSAGRVVVNGVDVAGANRGVAQAAGVEMVHQHSALVPELSVAEALELTRSARRVGPYRASTLNATWSALLADRGIELDVSQRVGDLSVELRQSIEIAATDPGPGGLLILDEPTAALPPLRVDALFERLRAVHAGGTTVVVVLHKLAEIRRLAHTVTVLRNGRLVLAATDIDGVGDEELAELIIGSTGTEQAADAATSAAPAPSAPPARRSLSVERVDARAAAGDRDLDGATLDLVAGRLTGLAGVEGNGQRTLVETLVGLRSVRGGSIARDTEDWTALDVAERRRRGLRAVPFDRFEEGVAEGLSLWMNLVGWRASRHRRWPRLPVLDTDAIRRYARRRLDAMSVAYQGLTQPAGSLSGGNLQRLILARELDEAEVMIAAQPTRGLDIEGTKVVWRALTELAASDRPVLVVSSDLDELLEHCHRIAVIRSGRIVAVHEAPFDRDRIGRDMVGAST